MQYIRAIIVAFIASSVGKNHCADTDRIEKSSPTLEFHIRPYAMTHDTESVAKVRCLGCKQCKVIQSLSGFVHL